MSPTLQPEQIANATPARTFVEPVESGKDHASRIVPLPQNWLAQDPHVALARAAALEDESERQSAINSACLEIAQSDPALEVQSLEKFDPAPDSRILADLTQLWTAADSAAATDWVLSRRSVRIAIVSWAAWPTSSLKTILIAPRSSSTFSGLARSEARPLAEAH